MAQAARDLGAQAPALPKIDLPKLETLIPETLGERIRFVRDKRGMNQTDVAAQMRALGIAVNHTSISRFEKWGSDDPNARQPDAEQVIGLCIVLGVRPRQLLGEDISSDRYRLLWLIDQYPESASLEKPSRQTKAARHVRLVAGGEATRPPRTRAARNTKPRDDQVSLDV